LQEETTIKDNQPLTEQEVLAIVKEDFQTAKDSKTEISTLMQDWKDLYEGKPLGNETDGRSKYVAKDAQNAVNWWIPNAMKPFMSSDDMVDATPRTADDVDNANSQNLLLNYQFNNSFGKYRFLHTSLMVYGIEGTAVARMGWIHEDETETIPFEGFTEQQLAELTAQGAEIEIEDEATIPMDAMQMNVAQGQILQTIYKGAATITKTTVSRPDAEVIKNEDFFIIGETIEDSDCCIQRIDTNRSDLRKQDKEYNAKGIYKNVDDIMATDKERDSTLGTSRENELKDYGQDIDSKTASKAREPITIYEYYGKIDMDGDGIAEPIVCTWSGNTILRISANPFPDEEPPFIGAPFAPVAFSFFGNGMPYFLEDNIKVKSAIMRTFIDLMANSTNGMKHIQKSSLDPLNIRRLREAKIGAVIEWNDINGYKPEVHNEIPASLQKMYELYTAEGENASGVTRYNQGLDAKSLNKTATGITAIMNQSQMRTWETTTRFAEQYLKPLFRKWIAYNQAFLDINVATRISGGEYVSISKDDIMGEFDLKINVAIAGSDQDRAQKIVQLLQMTQPLVEAQVLPPSHITKLIGELEELWEFKDLAAELKQIGEQPQQPTQ